MQENKFDIFITGGTLLTLSDKMDIIEDGFVGIQGDTIVAIGKNTETERPPFKAKETLKADGCIVMPGLVNTHTHVPMVCFRGMADDRPLMDWLTKYIWPAEARFVSKKMVSDSARLAAAEMILSGTTTFCDAYFFEDKIAEVVRSSGMRAVVSQGFADFLMPTPNAAKKIMAAAERFTEKWIDLTPLITPAFFCHAPYTCSPETLVTVKEASRRFGILFLIHLLENQDETNIILNRYGKPPVKYLLDLNTLDDRTVAVHCNWIRPEEMDIFAERGVKVSHNPESAMKLASGIAPVPDLLERGIVVGLGTDGCASNNDLDLFREMDTTAKIHKVTRLDATVMTAETVCKMATLGGAKVLGLEKHIGSLEKGKKADLIMVDINQPHLTPLYHYYSHLVYAARGADVKTSIINGKIVMKDRQLLTIDTESAMRKVRSLSTKINRQKARREN